MAPKKASKRAPKAPKEVLERMERGAKAPPGMNPKQRKAWEAATAGSADSWQPEKIGDYITGKLVSSEERKSKFGPVQVLSLDQGGKDGVKSVWCSTVLAREVERVQPKKGQTLMIVYQGKAQGQKGRPARLFGLSVVA